MRVLTLYSRPDCHLCATMEAALAPIIRGRAQLEVVNIEGDPKLEEAYALRIPVLVGDGRELSVYRLDVEALEAHLGSIDG